MTKVIMDIPHPATYKDAKNGGKTLVTEDPLLLQTEVEVHVQGDGCCGHGHRHGCPCHC